MSADNLSKTILPIGQLVPYNYWSMPRSVKYDFWSKKNSQVRHSVEIVKQGCGNTMLDLSDQVPFHSGQVKNFYLFVLGQVQCIKLIQFCISYFD